jgi:hypothetical protein
MAGAHSRAEQSEARAAVSAGECVTYRLLVRYRRGRRELLVMCSSSPGTARSWCAQAVACVTSCPMLRAAGLACVCAMCGAAGVPCEVEGVGRGGRSKTLLPLGRSWAPRAGMGAGQAHAGRQQLQKMRRGTGASAARREA